MFYQFIPNVVVFIVLVLLGVALVLFWKKKVDLESMPLRSWWRLLRVKDPDEGPMVLTLERIMVSRKYQQTVRCVITKPFGIYRSDVVSAWKKSKGEVHIYITRTRPALHDTVTGGKFEVDYRNDMANFTQGLVRCVGASKRA